MNDTPQFLLIVRERLRPGTEEAYDRNERQLATVAATMGCPHPYLALTTLIGPTEVWWLNAFASSDERDGLGAAYASNAPLMAAMGPLGTHKNDFRDTLSSTMTAYRGDLSGGAGLRITGARFLVIDTALVERPATGAVFEAADGAQFVIAAAHDGATADERARQFGPKAIIMAVQPQWSFPASSWIDADPDFWRSA